MMLHNEDALILAAREGDVEMILDVLEDIHERNCSDGITLQAALAPVFAIRDSEGNFILPSYISFLSFFLQMKSTLTYLQITLCFTLRQEEDMTPSWMLY
jgi:hypothetical protein